LSLIGDRPSSKTGITGWTWLLLALCAGAAGGFLLVPGDIGAKSHALLHGVCAQRSSHSLFLGGSPLPMDARMTGIYLGAMATVGWLWASGRPRAARLPPLQILLILAGFVVVMAVDGFNAMLADLGAPHPYEPSNALRLVTGTLAGVTLGVAAGHVFAAAAWGRGDRQQAVVGRPREIVPPLLIALAAGLPALSGLAIFHGPYSAGLVIAVVGVFSIVGTAILSVGLDRPGGRRTLGELAPVASMAVVLAVATLAGLAAARFLAEQHLGLPALT
jgi:uncharacterized membrane protein